MTLETCRLYLISLPKIDIGAFAESLTQALEGGDVGAFQLRLKNASDEEIVLAAKALIPICRKKEVAFILNDRPDLAAQVGADGVHLGQEDGSVKSARKIMGAEAVVGVSCHDSKHLAMVAGEDGADYVAFGAFYPTKSKSPEALAKYGVPQSDILEWWQAFTVLPCVAIGGINPSNCVPLVKAGADFIAVITAVWEHPQGAKKAVEEFNKAIESVRK